MTQPTVIAAFCAGCQTDRTIDRHWRALWVDSDGDFIDSMPERDCDLSYERPGTVLVCGQTCALRLYERYLDTGHVVNALQYQPNAQDIFTDALFQATTL